MTSAKPHHLTARRLLLQHLDLHPGKNVNADLDPLEAGIVGDTDHAAGGDSYHLGSDQTRARGSRNRYSVDEASRDARGLNEYASAIDIGYFAVTTSRGHFDLYDFNAWLLALIRAGDTDTADLREVIYSPDARTVRRWDRLGLRSTGDNSHLTHTHLSEHRDATGIRMVNLTRRWLQHIGLTDTEDDMTTKTEFIAWLKDPEMRAAMCRAVLTTDDVIPAPGNPKPGKNADGTPINTHWAAYSYLQNSYAAATSGREYAAAAMAAVKALAAKDSVDEQALAVQLAPAVAAALAPLLPAGQEVTEQALAAAFRSLFTAEAA